MTPLYRLYSTLTLLLLCTLLPAAAVGQLNIPGGQLTHNDAIFEQGEGIVSAGSGVFDPFYQVKKSNQAVVRGYNTSGAVDFETVGSGVGAATDLLLSTVTQVEIDGILYREFFLDINQTTGNNLYAINDIEIWKDTAAGNDCFDNSVEPGDWDGCGNSPELVYWLDGPIDGDTDIILDYTLEAGSGKRDMRMLVPDTNFDAPANCDYGQTGCGVYIYHYSLFGQPPGDPNDDGFEEWSTSIQPFVQIEKTAEGSLEETTDWTITKDVTPETWGMFTGDEVETEYTIQLDKTVTQGNIAVAGTISLYVPDTLPDGDENASSAYVTALTDYFEGLPATSISCTDNGGSPISTPFTIDPGETFLCAYSIALGSEVTGENVATAQVEINDQGETRPFIGTATVSSYDVTSLGEPGTVNVTDTNGLTFGPFSDDATETYEKIFTCNADEGENPNTASIDETGDSDDALVTIDCFDVIVSKDADTYLEQHYSWTVEKGVDPASWALFMNESGTSDYEIDVTRSIAEQRYSVAGTITVSVEAGAPVLTLNGVSDVVTPGPLSPTVDCGGVTFPHGVYDGTPLVCTYGPIDVPSDGSYDNVATAAARNYRYTLEGGKVGIGSTDWDSDPYPFDFSDPILTEIDETATVTDDWATPGTPGDDASWQFGGDGNATYSITFACDADEGTRTNTVVITGDDTGTDYDSDDATVTVACYELAISKDAQTSYTETTDWTIDKTVVPDSWELMHGDDALSQYTVILDKTVTPSDWAVAGVITVANNTPLDATLLGVSDEITPGPVAETVDCGVTFPYVLLAGESLDCDYSADLIEDFSGENDAEVRRRNNDYDSGGTPTPGGETVISISELVPIDFADATVTQEGEPGTVNVTDDNGSPAQTGDDREFGPFVDDATIIYSKQFTCEEDGNTRINWASIDETDDSDDASVSINCWNVAVVKDAHTSLQRSYRWTLEKGVSPDEWQMFTGDTGTSDYTIDVTRTRSDSDFGVDGNITVSIEAGAPIGADITGLEDVVAQVFPPTDGLLTDIDCGDATFPFTITDGSPLECTYSASLPDAEPTKNRATAYYQNYSYNHLGGATPILERPVHSNEADIIFNGGTEVEIVDDMADLDDTNGGGGPWSLPNGTDCGEEIDNVVTCQIDYSETFACREDVGENPNLATLVADDTGATLQSGALVTVNCFDLEVRKEADTEYNREYEWMITKKAFDLYDTGRTTPVSSLTLEPGMLYEAVYRIGVDLDDPAYVDSDWMAVGDIWIENPAPIDALLNDVTDVIEDLVATVVADVDVVPNCGVTFPYVLGDGETLHCTYSASLATETIATNVDRNTAYAELQNHEYASDLTKTPLTGTFQTYSGYDEFALGEPTSLTDLCTEITDDHPAAPTPIVGTVCIDDDLPAYFEYQYDIQPTVDDCDGITITNIATQTEEDTGDTSDATWTIEVDVPCPDGCTLTLGYWKTHNQSFTGGASKKADPTWLALGDKDLDTVEEFEGEVFFVGQNGSSGDSWFDVFWMSPKGNAYYNLAHQWMAAYLNCMNVDPQVQPDCSVIAEEMALAEQFFADYEPGDVGKGKGKNKDLAADLIDWAGVLGSFNEGDIGPGHCSENGEPVPAKLAVSVEAALALEAEDGVTEAVAEETAVEGESKSDVANVKAASMDEEEMLDESPAKSEIDAFEPTPIELPSEFAVGNYPNPFNPTTTIQIALPEASHVRVAVYDVLGRMVTMLMDGQMSAGTHSVTFDAGSFPSGVYLYRFEYDGGAITKTMQLLK